jgi:Fe-S-cluster-containing hydrogenase component 2
VNTSLRSPLQSLQAGHWFKLICGASYQHLPAVRNLSLIYALAGADCIDVSADAAVVAAARKGVAAAKVLAQSSRDVTAFASGPAPPAPWLMISLNDGEDPHFRKATFDPQHCPADCPRPCADLCPAAAIPPAVSTEEFQGVIAERCYGCGRCLPVCPLGLIQAQAYQRSVRAIAPLLATVDAVELHTQVGHFSQFQRLWTELKPWTGHLKLIAISCPDGPDLLDYLWQLYHLIQPLSIPLVWQTDGRPMSGDIGNGATRATLRLGAKVLASGPPGYVQLAGGTNASTVPKLQAQQLLPRPGTPLALPHNRAVGIAGIAYGSYARTQLQEILTSLPDQVGPLQIETNPQGLHQALALAAALIHPLKQPHWHFARGGLSPPVSVR